MGLSERDGAAEERDSAAEERDSAAEARDSAARRRDIAADEREWVEGLSISQRESAARDREGADRDRRAGSRDRERAAEDRRRAAGDRAQAGIDGLTGALQRERGRVDLQREIEQARRSDGRLVLAFVDVDNLKAINDAQGHAAGDQLLRDVGVALMAGLRSYDIVVRYGGDEFLCVLTGTDLEGARGRFEEVARSLKARSSEASVSVGLAALAEREKLDELIARADAALVAGRRHTRAPSQRPGSR